MTVVHNHYDRRRFLGGAGIFGLGILTGENLTNGNLTKEIKGGWEKIHPTPESEVASLLSKNQKFTLITPELSPKHYRIFNKTFNDLLTLIPAEQRDDYIKPSVVVIPDEQDNGFFNSNQFSEKSVVSITSEAYTKKTDAALEQLFGHELGHWLRRNNEQLAKELSGFNSPNVQLTLRNLRLQVEAAIPDKNDAQAKYDELCEELIADGISIRLEHGATAAIENEKSGQEWLIKSKIDFILDDYSYPSGVKDTLRTQLTKILQQADTKAISDHPPTQIRIDFMQQVAKAFGYKDIGPSSEAQSR